MRTITCDRCGARITKGETIGHISFWHEAGNESDASDAFTGWDFCPECIEEIDQYIRIPLPFNTPSDTPADTAFSKTLEEELDIESEDEPISESISEPINEPLDEPKEDKDAALAKQRAEQEKEAEAAGPDALKHGNWLKRADWGKFRACVAAGRDDAWLAVEFGVTTRTIWNWKKKLKEIDEAEQTK